MASMIEVDGITSSFGNQVVHQGLDLTLEDGEILGLVGGSGSGKSVLLRTILGLRRPQAGRIFIHGRDIYHLRGRDKRDLQKKWGVLFQDGALFSSLNVLDNIGLPLREHTGLDRKAVREIALLKLRIVGLEPEAAEKFPSALSGGMARRAALARALALDPDILFLDEPTGGLDPGAAAAFDSLILSLHDALKLTILIITHDLDTMTAVCSRIAMIADKRIETGTFLQMTKSENEKVRRYFSGPRVQSRIGGGN